MGGTEYLQVATLCLHNSSSPWNAVIHVLNHFSGIVNHSSGLLDHSRGILDHSRKKAYLSFRDEGNVNLLRILHSRISHKGSIMFISDDWRCH